MVYTRVRVGKSQFLAFLVTTVLFVYALRANMLNETINQKMVEKALAVDKDAIYYFHLIDIDSQFQT